MEAVSQTGTFPHNYTPISEPEGLGDFPEYPGDLRPGRHGLIGERYDGVARLPRRKRRFRNSYQVAYANRLAVWIEQRRRPARHGADDESGVRRCHTVGAGGQW